MNAVKGLTVIECKYNYNAWKVDCTGPTPIFSSQLKQYNAPRAVDLFHEKNSYSRIGVPYLIREVDYEHYKGKYSEPYAGVTREFSDEVFSAVSAGNVVLVAGGFCNYAPAILGGLQRSFGPSYTIGVVWIDAHADCCVPDVACNCQTLVGVPMSVMLGLTLDQYRKDICGLDIPCKGDNLVASDIRILDQTTAGILCREHVHKLDTTAFNDSSRWTQEIQSLADRVDAIYLSVDADILRPEFVPAYFSPVPYGNDVDTVKRNIATVLETGKVGAMSMFCFDFDRYANGGDVTYENGRTILEHALSHWKHTSVSP